jgi:hypothetical protein
MKKISLPVIGLIFLALVVLAIFMILRSSGVVPKEILKQLNYSVFYPQQSQLSQIQLNSFKYDKSIKVLFFTVIFDGRHITFAEQSSPDSFAADPNFYPSLVKSLGGYASFDTLYGRADLTRPKQIASETGVMNAKGTLLFAKSDGDLSEDNWKLLFNSLLYIQPK